MHRCCDFFRFWPLLALSIASVVPSAHAAQLATPLYGAVVANADAQQAAQDAMRQVLVRLTGARDAASDPALAGLISDARRYVQLQRRTTTGTTQVLFDAGALRDAINAAGRSVWGPDRPLVWVLLPQQDEASAQTLRARVTAAAQVRGLPVMIAAGGAAGADASLAAARRAGATAALTAAAAPGETGSLQWILAAPTADGRWSGGPELAIDETTDALVRAARALDVAPVAELDCRITGVSDLASYASVVSALRTTPEVSEVAVSAVDADNLLLHLKVRGNQAELERALANDRLRATGASVHGAVEYRYQAGP
jgi:hypothetical protein